MAESQSDATLLERFVSDREEAAFAALVRRHGPRVERICRRILRNEHDVEDVFQATFLVLARKAPAIPWRDSVSPWIDGVARRLAMHARSGSARLRGRELGMAALAGMGSGPGGRLPERFHPMVDPSSEVDRRDLRRVLDDELLRLPEKYRAPVVLCDLEGHTREEAARRLGWPAGSMSRRLDRARTLLRQRLTGRGVALGTIGLASLAIAAAAIGLGPDRDRRDPSVRHVMATFRPVSEGGDGHGPILAAAARGQDSPADFARILPAARAAAAAASRLGEHDPGRSGLLWTQLAGEMRDSARELERACEASDATALVAAARRLDASCVRCHAAFRRDRTPADVPVEVPAVARVSLRPRIADPTGRAAAGGSGPMPSGADRTSGTSTGGPISLVIASRPDPAHPPDAGPAMSFPVLQTSNGFAGGTVMMDGPERSCLLGRSESSTGGRCPPETAPYPPDPWNGGPRFDATPA